MTNHTAESSLNYVRNKSVPYAHPEVLLIEGSTWHFAKCLTLWWAMRDSNPRPLVPETNALSN